MSDGYALKMENINKSFNGIPVLKGVDFYLKPGEVHALIGANGAGKSTLMKILTGVYKKDSGTITLNGKQVEFHSPTDSQSSGVAMIYQELSLIPTMTVAQNVFLQREKKSFGNLFLNDKSSNKMAKEIFQELGVEDIDPKAKVGSLSVGYMQVVEIAKALSIHGAKVLVMDEPTASLSEAETNALFKFIGDLKKSGISIVYISHRMQEIFKICDRATIIKDGMTVLSEECEKLTINKIVEKMIGINAENSFVWRERPEVDKGAKAMLEVKGLVPTSKMSPIDFKVYPGEIVGLAGLMGSGRTEIVECIFGIRSPRQGEVWMNGKKVTSIKAAMKAGIALLPENRRKEGLILDHSVRSNIMSTNIYGFSKSFIMNDRKGKRVTEEYIDKLSIKTESGEKVVRLLSGGNQQKVVLAKWLATNPKLLILDEPTIGVDIGSKAEIVEMVRKIADQGVSVVVISSELAELLAISDRLIILHNGEMTGEIMRKEIGSEEVLHSAIQGV